MGWTSFYIGANERTQDVIKRELTDYSEDGASWTVEDYTMRGSVFYGIMCRHQADSTKRAAGSPEKMFYGIVVLTEYRTRGGAREIFYKEMTEDAGPCYYEMPARMLDFLDKHTEPVGFSAQWRAQCRAQLEKKRLKAAARRAQVKRLQTA
jgi:hypothetical protein